MKSKAADTDKVTERELRNRAIAFEAATEGIVLLENKGVLPMAPGRIALYGAGADYTIPGGSGSGEVNVRHSVSVLEGLEEAGFELVTKDWTASYDNLWKSGKEAYIKSFRRKLLRPSGHMLAELMAAEYRYPAGDRITAKADADSCIYVLSRQSGEGHDRTDEPGNFRLEDTEIHNIRFCASAYRHFVLVINTGAPIDLTPLDKMEGIDAIVYMGQLGMEGGRALAAVLTGKCCPSGKLAVTWPMAYQDVPFGREYGKDPLKALYKEGIYVGYRYYDSFGVAPRYPFGHGLGYTDFSIKADAFSLDKEAVHCRVTVKNEGKTFRGREVVQIYVCCPGADREFQRLAAFGKTGVLAPGEAQSLGLSFPLSLLARYDEEKAQTVLPAGRYLLAVGNSSRNTEAAASLCVAADIVVSRHKNLCKASVPVAELHHVNEVSIPDSLPELYVDGIQTQNIDYKEPEAAVRGKAGRILDGFSPADMVQFCTGTGLFGQKKGFKVPGSVGHTTADYIGLGIPNVEMCDGPAGIRLEKRAVQYPNGDIKGVDLSISLYEFLPKFLLRMFVLGNPDKGKMLYQFVTGFPVEAMVAQTWNTELAGRIGRAVSEEMTEYGVSIWLAPALNIVRNPLCGRNYEYYSEDPLISGKMAAAVTKGVQATAGNHVTIKHFCANNQEDNRYYASSEVDERVLREIYWKGFEIAVKESAPHCVMTAYNKVNGTYCANSHDLCTELLRREWGFDGIVMTDWLSTGKDRADEATCIESGVDIIMPGGKKVVKTLLRAHRDGRLPLATLARACGRMLSLLL